MAYIDPENKFAIEDKLSQVNLRFGEILERKFIIFIADQHAAAAPKCRFLWLPEETTGKARFAHTRSLVRYLYGRYLLFQ